MDLGRSTYVHSSTTTSCVGLDLETLIYQLVSRLLPLLLSLPTTCGIDNTNQRRADDQRRVRRPQMLTANNESRLVSRFEDMHHHTS